MSKLFFQLGRTLGYAAIPALRKSRSAWKSLTGNEVESVEAEAEFGRALATELRLKTGVSRAEPEVTLVGQIQRRLVACVRNKARTFRVEVLRDPTLSALALPGGFIFLSAGLVDFCQHDPDELAFVIGHEMGHVVRGHALERVLVRIGSEGLSSILSRGLLTPMLRDAGLQWLQNAYSQEAEWDADEFGVRICAAAGYRAEAAYDFLQRIAALRATGQPLGEYLASHASEAERIARIRAVLASRPALRA